jgi:hypothetical protein
VDTVNRVIPRPITGPKLRCHYLHYHQHQQLTQQLPLHHTTHYTKHQSSSIKMTENRKVWGGRLTRSNTVAPPAIIPKSVRKVGRFASLRHAFARSAPQAEEQQTNIRASWDQYLVPRPLKLKGKERRASNSSFSSTETVLYFRPRVFSHESVQLEAQANSHIHSHYGNKPLPLLPQPLKQKQVSKVKPSREDDWETAVDESYELGEFVDAEVGNQWLEREKERSPTQAQLERVIERGRSISARRFREVYYVDRPQRVERK